MSKFTKECRESTRANIINSFDLDNLEALCFTLYINFDDLAGLTIDKKVRSLIIYFEHRNDVETLVEYLKKQRPSITWCAEYIDENAEMRRDFDELTSKGRAAVDSIGRLNKIMAESRLLELEITTKMFSGFFSLDQRQRMQKHIDELRQITITNL